MPLIPLLITEKEQVGEEKLPLPEKEHA